MLDIQKYIGRPRIITSKIDDMTATFEVQYLPRGFGWTMGNAIRRAILGYDIGGAVTGLKIKGVPHEYYVIDGVKESVLDIMLNFKKIRFDIAQGIDKIQWVSQRFKGVGVYTVSDLKLPSGVTILTDDVYLFEITDNSTQLVVEYRIEKGYGYYSVEFLRKREKQQEAEDSSILLIDNDFKLVDYINYDVQEIIDDFTGGTKDKLTIQIKTISPKISPQQVVSFAGEVISSYARLFVFDEAYIDKEFVVDYSDIVEGLQTKENTEVKVMPIDALPLSERTRNALMKNNILYVEELEKKRKSELLTMKGVGKKAVDEIQQALSNINKSLAG